MIFFPNCYAIILHISLHSIHEINQSSSAFHYFQPHLKMAGCQFKNFLPIQDLKVISEFTPLQLIALKKSFIFA